MSRILHKVVTGCNDCPAYYTVYDDDGCPCSHDCTLGASFPWEPWVFKKIEPNWFAPDCPLKEQTEGEK